MRPDGFVAEPPPLALTSPSVEGKVAGLERIDSGDMLGEGTMRRGVTVRRLSAPPRRRGPWTPALAALVTTVAAVGVQIVTPVPPARAGTVTTAITQTGETAFHVPATVTSIDVDAVGAPGADRVFTNPAGGPPDVAGVGGAGAEVKATLAVTQGSTLYVEVDTGGGAGEGTNGHQGHGGGSSDIRSCSSTDPNCPRLGSENFTTHLWTDPRLV